jgi:transcriptional regulator of acetoin/glycerol metabolism
MDQRPIVLFLSMKGLSIKDIHDEFVIVLGSDAIDYSMVTKYLRHTRIPPIPMETIQKPSNTITDDAILDTLQQQPFSSVMELAKFTCIPRSTVYRHLT